MLRAMNPEGPDLPSLPTDKFRLVKLVLEGDVSAEFVQAIEAVQNRITLSMTSHLSQHNPISNDNRIPV